MIKSYLKYFQKRLNAHGIHSPFVFEFYNQVLKKSKVLALPEISDLHARLKKNDSVIEVLDLGAGSRRMDGSRRVVSEVAKNAVIRPKYGKLLYRLVEFYQLKNCLELGTSLGVGTAYIACAPLRPSVMTVEGCKNTAAIAQANFKSLGLNNIEQKIGEFEDVLKHEIPAKINFDLIFIDGNHQYESTLAYFDYALAHSHDNSFIIFDDIHWSEGMEKAWGEICTSPHIHVSMDLFQFGIVCKKSTQRKQHFVLKY